jgi:uroporphyrinogen-III synthase
MTVAPPQIATKTKRFMARLSYLRIVAALTALRFVIMAFDQARVLAFESRRAKEMAELIRINGGEPFVAPALTEVPLDHNHEAFTFASRLFAGEFDMVIFLTGVGARLLGQILAVRELESRFREALRNLTVVARGPKPIAVLREWQVGVTVAVPEPNTWRELLAAIANRPEKSAALQEYGRGNTELLQGLAAQGRSVFRVPVYQWALPSDTEPLSLALKGLLAGEFQAAIFTTGVQIEHFLEFARSLGHRDAAVNALRRIFIASIGPTCSESLRACGLQPALEPSHPKMGILVREAALRYAEIRT